MATRRWDDIRTADDAPEARYPTFVLAWAWAAGYNAAVDTYKEQLNEALRKEQA